MDFSSFSWPLEEFPNGLERVRESGYKYEAKGGIFYTSHVRTSLPPRNPIVKLYWNENLLSVQNVSLFQLAPYILSQ